MSVMKEIETKEAQIKSQILQLEMLEEKIRRNLVAEERSYFENEINILKDSLFQAEKELKMLHQKNRRSFFMALSLFVIIIFIILYFTS